jgi:hypothetical protein
MLLSCSVVSVNVTITEEGEVRGLKNLERLDGPDLFTEFVKDSTAFAQFLQNHWKETYSSLFVFHHQSVNPAFPYSFIHVYPAENAKGNPQIIKKLFALKNKLDTEFGLLFLDLLLVAILVLTPITTL